MHRIQVTKDEGLIYVGKHDLKVLEMRNQRYSVVQNLGHGVNSFIDIKLLKNTGELIVFEENTSDLVRYSPSLQAQQNRLEGRRPLDLEGAEIVTTLYNGDHITYIWMLGDNSVGLVDTATFEYDIIENFFGESNISVTPFTVIASNKQKKLLGLYIQDNQLFFAFWKGQGAITRKLQSDVLEDSKFYILVFSRDCALYGDFN